MRDQETLTVISEAMAGTAFRPLMPHAQSTTAVQKAAKSLSRASVKWLSENPGVMSSIAVSDEDVKQVYEGWRAASSARAESTVPFHRMSLRSKSALRNAVSEARRVVSAKTSGNDVTRAVAADERFSERRDTEALELFTDNSVPEDALSAVHELLHGTKPVPDELLALALQCRPVADTQHCTRAVRNWARQHGFKDGDVTVDTASLDRDIVCALPESDPRHRSVSDRIAREWSEDTSPNAITLVERLHRLRDDAADRALASEFAQAASTAEGTTWVASSTATSAALKATESSPQDTCTGDALFRRAGTVGEGDVNAAARLLRRDVSFGELADEYKRLSDLPSQARSSYALTAIEDRARRLVLIESGVHPRHMDTDALPAPAYERVCETLKLRVARLGEDYLEHGVGESLDDLSDEWRTADADKRGELAVEPVRQAFQDARNGDTYTYSQGQMSVLVSEMLRAAGAMRARKSTALPAAHEQMDPLF